MIRRRLCLSRPSLVSWLHITPDDTMTRRLETSQRSGSASRARRIGLAKASPTIDSEFTRSRCTVSSSSTVSNDRPSSVTMEPAAMRMLMALKAPVPCISGAAGMATGPGLVTLARRASTSGSSGSGRFVRRVEADEDVVLAPHDALRHAGRAAGVEEVEVVAAAAPRRSHPRAGPPPRLPRTGWPSRGRPAAGVVHTDPGPDAGHALADALDGGRRTCRGRPPP